MPIPDAQKINFEVAILGSAATGGSSVTPSINIFQFRRTSVVPAITKLALYNAFNTNIIAPLLLAMNVRYTVNNVTVRCLNDALDAPQSFANAGVGAIATDSLPSNQAVYMLIRTALRGKWYRGSKHFGPANEVDTTNDLLTGAGLARWQVVQAALLAGFADANANNWVLQVFSRSLSIWQSNPTNITANDATEVLLDKNIGSMRKRRSQTVR